MKSGQITSDAQKIEVAKSICEQYAKNEHTIESCCNHFGISDRTFYNWIHKNKEIKKMYEYAKKYANNIDRSELLAKAKSSLHKLVEGYTITEKKIIQRADSVEVVEAKEKHIPINSTAVFFTLVNLSDGEYKHKQDIKHKGGIDFPLKIVTKVARKKNPPGFADGI
ncbi:MAG: helix-turn-helix domain-containing protein [Polaribacter sp.]